MRASSTASRASARRAASPASRNSDDSANRSPRHNANAWRSVTLASSAASPASCPRPWTANDSKRSTSTSTTSAGSRYPGDWVRITSGQPAAARVLRSRETSTRNDTLPNSGGSSPQTTSTSQSMGTTRPTFSASSTRIRRSFAAPIGTQPPPQSTWSGPSKRTPTRTPLTLPRTEQGRHVPQPTRYPSATPRADDRDPEQAHDVFERVCAGRSMAAEPLRLPVQRDDESRATYEEPS